ncbi:MAG: YidC/Oxa1 family membrane protein insertase [Lachnospiraceae bacterium]|nr:YidC/Oxa1 family membrane protein insertase [Lachnospiraceae bacterium]
MEGILLTQNSTFILGPIAKVLGIILNAIFNVVPNIGVAIIIFTVVIYLILLPLTYKQQKFSKLSAKMNPEVQAIQEKYKNKKDQESMARQNQELQEVYKKYGVSPTGSCLQLLIQMPILFALYRVIYNIPAYVDKVFNCLEPLAENIISTVSGISTISALETTTKNFPKYAANGNFTGDTALRSVVDVLNRASSAEWDAIGNIQGLDVNIFNTAREQFEHFNNFLGLNISNSPLYTIKGAFPEHNFILVIGALMIPVLAALTQWINTLFMPSPSSGNDNNTMVSTMKSMNIMMPLMSAVFTFSLPCGLGIYWIAGAVVRSIQQVIINKHIDKLDLDSIIEKNAEKYKNKKREVPSKTVTSSASISTRALGNSSVSKEKEEALNRAKEAYAKNNNPNSIAAKANLVRDYNERNK